MDHRHHSSADLWKQSLDGISGAVGFSNLSIQIPRSAVKSLQHMNNNWSHHADRESSFLDESKELHCEKQGGGETVVFLQNCNNTLAHTLFDIAWQHLSGSNFL